MQKKKHKWIIWVGVVVLLLAGVGIGLLVWNSNKAKEPEKKEETVDIHLEALLQSYGVTDPEADSDGDGLLDGEEEKMGLNKFAMDTDDDGISDSYELNVSLTNPAAADSDGDGICDSDELTAGLDPNNRQSDGESDDGDRIFEREVALSGGSLEISGAANIYSLYTGVESESNLSMLPGVYGDVHEFFLDGTAFETATLTLKYNKREVEKAGYSAENLQIYQVLDDLSLLPVECVNDGNGTVTATLQHFSKYALADAEYAENKEESKTKVMLLIDNSGSMFEMEGSAANDPEMKRLEMAKQLIGMTKEECEFQVSKFTASYMELTQEWSSDAETLEAAINGITEDEVFNGTYIANSVIQSTKKFSTEDKSSRKFIVILTDGETTESGIFCYTVTEAIQKAIEKNISVIAIGLGNSVDADYLMQLADETGGFYVYANNADALERVAERITASINYNHIDKDGDGEYDSVVVADTGFVVDKDGFSFPNYALLKDGEVINGQCYGMAMFAQLYYSGKLPMSGEEFTGAKFGFIGNKEPLYGEAYDFFDVPGYENESGSFMNNTESLASRFDFSDYVDYSDDDDKREREDKDSDKLVLKEKYNDMAEENPLFEIVELELDKKQEWKDGEKIKFYDELCLTIDDVNEEELSEEQQELYEMLHAINHYFAYQSTDKVKGIDPLTTDISTSDSNLQEDAFHEVIQKLKEGVPLVLSAANHAINALRIERSLDNPLEYKLMVYDNNYPGEEKCITIKKTMRSGFYYLNATNWSNECRFSFYDDDGIFGKKGKQIDVMFYYAN